MRYFFEYAPSGFEEVNPTIYRESGLRVELTESKARTPIRFASKTLPQTPFEVNRKMITDPGDIDYGTVTDVQLAPFGDWTQTAEDKDGNPVEIVQHVTPETMGRVVEAFSKKVVVDVDRKSADGTDSRAAAWVKSVCVDPERGLVGEIEFTPYGADLVSGMEYRFVSVGIETDRATREFLKESFEDQIFISGETVKWKAELFHDALMGKSSEAFVVKVGKIGGGTLSKLSPEQREYMKNKGLSFTRDFVTHTKKHTNDKHPITEGDYDLLPVMWRAVDRASIDERNRLTIELDAFDGTTLVLGVDVKGYPRASTFYKKQAAPVDVD